MKQWEYIWAVDGEDATKKGIEGWEVVQFIDDDATRGSYLMKREIEKDILQTLPIPAFGGYCDGNGNMIFSR